MSQIFTLPVSRASGIEDVLALRDAQLEVRVQSIADATLVRLLCISDRLDHASSWVRAQPGARLAIGSLAGSAGLRIVLLEGAAQPVAMPIAEKAP